MFQAKERKIYQCGGAANNTECAKYFQEESKSGNKPQFRAGGAVIAKTAAATGVSKNSVRKIVSAGKVIDEGKTRKAKVRFGKL